MGLECGRVRPDVFSEHRGGHRSGRRRKARTMTGMTGSASLSWADDEPFVVAELLDQFAGWHDPADHEIYLIELNGTEVELVFDVGEDEFRDGARDPGRDAQVGRCLRRDRQILVSWHGGRPSMTSSIS